MAKTTVILRSRLLPTNEEIAAALAERYRKFILGTSVKMGNRYRFSQEDRDDLVSFISLRLYQINWHGKLRDNRDWIQKNHKRPEPWAPWTMQEVYKCIGGYAYKFILNAMVKESRRLLANGLSGLGWRKKISEFPFHEDEVTEEPASAHPESVIAANEIGELAKKILSPDEWVCVGLQFGMDGGGDRTPDQVAKQLGRSRDEIRRVLDGAMEKLQKHVLDGEPNQ